MARWCLLVCGVAWCFGTLAIAGEPLIEIETLGAESQRSTARLILLTDSTLSPATAAERVANQRRELIAAMEQLQQEYCKAGMLDAALLVRRQLRVLERQDKVPFPALPAPQEPAGPGPRSIGPRSSSSTTEPSPPTSLPPEFGREIGQAYFLRITGRTDGPIWGSGVYTTDSDLGTAAVHAGLLRLGESGVARVTVLPGRPHYESTTAHGVTTHAWESYPSSFRFDGIGQTISTASHLRGQETDPLPVYVVGRTGGTVWGTDDYTDDSDIATAAVHAGLVRVGEEALVQLTLRVGHANYIGSTRNGVSSLNYGSWGGTYRLSAVPSVPVLEPLKGVTNLEERRSKAGALYQVELTGSLNGAVYGTDFYTTDSHLASAAVHAGLLEPGQTAILTVEILGERTGFVSSTRNGVTSSAWESWGAFRFVHSAEAKEGATDLPASEPKLVDPRRLGTPNPTFF